MSKVVRGTFIATSDPIPGRRVQLTEDDIRTIAERVTIGEESHVAINHDARVAIVRRVVNVELRRTDSGSLGVWVDAEFDEADLAKFPDGFGWSMTFGKPVISSDPASTKPEIQVILDGENFDDETLTEIVEGLRPSLNVSAGWLTQLQTFPDPLVVLALAAQWVVSLPPDLLRAIILDGIKDRVFHPRSGGKTRFEIDLVDGERRLRSVIETSDREAFRDGIGLLRDAWGVPDAMVVEIIPETGEIRRIR